MKKFIITGPSKAVNGMVNISGAKNSCLPLMAASILFKKEVILRNVPLVQDVFTMKDLLISLGSKVKILEKKRIMIITNKKTGRDVSHLVVAMWENLITQDEFELLAMIYE